VKNIFILFSCLFGNLSWSQTRVIGKCVDASGKVIEGISIFVNNDTIRTIDTDSSGMFSIKLKPENTYVLRFVYDRDELAQRTVKAIENQTYDLGNVKFKFNQFEGGITVEKSFDIPRIPILKYAELPFNIEKALVFLTAASSNNELSSNFNVRGGNYDENLIYVNGFQINRPFLTRTGQQEGLSFINSALVGNIGFSAGGFDAQYGDKLSSVLDITYRTPTKFSGSAVASVMGVEMHLEDKLSSRFTYQFGARYRANGYLLNSLPAKGAYNPRFLDAQLVTNYALTEKLSWEMVLHHASNIYNFAPESQNTKFGTFNQSLAFKVYFEGQEKSQFNTSTFATAFKYKPNSKTNLDFYGSFFRSNEKENYDILGEYFINELENDPSKENYGDSVATLGIGGFLDHARNQLKANVINLYHNGLHKINTKQEVKWGVSLQQDIFKDQLSEWKYVDSTGYNKTELESLDLVLFETVKGKLDLQTKRFSGFFQHTWNNTKKIAPLRITRTKKQNTKDGKKRVTISDSISTGFKKLTLISGVRMGYTEINQEFYITPRISLTYIPNRYFLKDSTILRRNTRYRLSIGTYYQPPFYREFRTLDGKLNPEVKSQKSVHAVIGNDFYFFWLGRKSPFKLSSEVYYKYLWDVNPYEVSNVRTRYFANNDAIAYAYGADAQLHGEFIKGIQSFFKVGLLHTKEDLKGDFYYDYYNSKNEKIILGASEDIVAVDSIKRNAGFIPRPTDQWFNTGILFQDQMPKFEALTIQLGLQYGTRLPYGPPTNNRYADTLRQKYYFRTDVGITYDFLYGKNLKEKKQWVQALTDVKLSLEIFNVMGIFNVLSNQWVQDVNGRYYAIPNYLTQRRFNLKLIVKW
jgi:TonB-dependent Receptor Plug Domain